MAELRPHGGPYGAGKAAPGAWAAAGGQHGARSAQESGMPALADPQQMGCVCRVTPPHPGPGLMSSLVQPWERAGAGQNLTLSLVGQLPGWSHQAPCSLTLSSSCRVLGAHLHSCQPLQRCHSENGECGRPWKMPEGPVVWGREGTGWARHCQHAYSPTCPPGTQRLH